MVRDKDKILAEANDPNTVYMAAEGNPPNTEGHVIGVQTGGQGATIVATPDFLSQIFNFNNGLMEEAIDLGKPNKYLGVNGAGRLAWIEL